MTDDQARALGQRWVAACKARGVEAWRPGMLWVASDAVTSEPVEGRLGCNAETIHDLRNTSVVRDPWPDFRDSATLGAAIGAVREVWGEPCAYAWPNKHGDHWQVFARTSQTENLPLGGGGDSEAACVVAAMEAAP